MSRGSDLKATICRSRQLLKRPTFADAVAITRRRLWSGRRFSTLGQNMDVVKVPRSLLERLTDVGCYAA
jgi:hypothetical protein